MSTGASIHSLSDESLMGLYQKGEIAAFDELYRRHATKVLGFLKSKLSQQEAEDLLQSVFLKLHAYRDRYQPSYLFLTWLFTITRNLLTDFYRKKRPLIVESKDLERHSPAVEEMPLKSVQEQVWESLLQQISPHQQELLRLRITEGLSFEEIGKKLGEESPTIRKRMSRLYNKLRNLREEAVNEKTRMADGI